MNVLIKPQFLKKTLKFLFPVSFLFFSYSSWLPYLSYHLNLNFYTFAFHITNHSIDRNYIFLLFNGILVFLCLVGSSSFKSTADVQSADSDVSVVYPMNDDIEKGSVAQSVGYLRNVIVEEDREVEKYSMMINDLKEENIDFFITDHEQVQEEEDKRLDSFIDEVEEGKELLSTEELNRKCEDFIRRMKEQIRIRAQQQS